MSVVEDLKKLLGYFMDIEGEFEVYCSEEAVTFYFSSEVELEVIELAARVLRGVFGDRFDILVGAYNDGGATQVYVRAVRKSN